MSAAFLDVVLGIAIGLVLLVAAGPLSKRMEQERAERLAELEAGSGEDYFEEKRSLEAYSRLGATAFRLLGGALLVLSMVFALSGPG